MKSMTADHILWKCIQLSLGLALPLLIPYLQFGVVYQLWSQHSVTVKREHCQNSCWDTNFKAGYETGAGSYKHVYFNGTWQAGAMWAMTLVVVIGCYESVKYLAQLWVADSVRWRMVILFLSAVYPHYYAFWAMWNYMNDDFYSQVTHQLLFTSTELVSTLMVLHLADTGTQAQPAKLLVIIGIAGGHVLAAGWDQFVGNVLLQEGGLHQILRDLGFMLPDLLHIYLPVKELQVYGAKRRIFPAYLISNKMAAATLSTSAAIWLLSAIL